MAGADVDAAADAPRDMMIFASDEKTAASAALAELLFFLQRNAPGSSKKVTMERRLFSSPNRVDSDVLSSTDQLSRSQQIDYLSQPS